MPTNVATWNAGRRKDRPRYRENVARTGAFSGRTQGVAKTSAFTAGRSGSRRRGLQRDQSPPRTART
jgi:hypothetical protein